MAQKTQLWKQKMKKNKEKVFAPDENPNDVVHVWHPLKFTIKENYKFIRKGFFFNIFSFLLYCFCFLVLWPINQLHYGLKVKGKKNLKGIKGAVVVSNHVLFNDYSTLFTHVFYPKHPYILAGHEGFKVPVARHLIKLLKAVPTPVGSTPKTYAKFFRETCDMLSSGGKLIVFPEGSMFPFYNGLREFSSGAFKFSVKTGVPIVPIVTTYRKPSGIYKLFGRKKPLATINILPKIDFVANENLTNKENEQALKEIVFNTMQAFFNENSTYSYTFVPKKKKQ